MPGGGLTEQGEDLLLLGPLLPLLRGLEGEQGAQLIHVITLVFAVFGCHYFSFFSLRWSCCYCSITLLVCGRHFSHLGPWFLN